MPFGLTNAPAVFQALGNDVLRDFLNVCVFVYFDDILTFSPDETTHIQHFRQVLQRLLENQLFVKAEKCDFHVSSMSFLGLIVVEGEVRMDPEKVIAVINWPTLSCRKEVQHFLGFANFYRRFIENFSSVASTLHALTSSKTLFSWGQAGETAFQQLKRSFTTAPVVVLPDSNLQFLVEVDASDLGIGAVLSSLLPEQVLSEALGQDFVTVLPLSQGNTTILSVVDRFPKMGHFIPLPKLPSAKVFRIHGFPINVLFDRGPQFVAQFWRAFCSLLGATVSFSSRHHPQTNGQTVRMNQEMETGL